MAEHHTCDRCGKPAKKAPAPPHHHLVNMVRVPGWHGDNGTAVETITVSIRFYGNHLDGDGASPDLCVPCQVEIIALALAADSDYARYLRDFPKNDPRD